MLTEIEVGKIFKRARRKSGMKLCTIAAAAGVAPHTINAIERGAHYPSYALIKLLTDVYGMDIRDVFDGGERDGR